MKKTWISLALACAIATGAAVCTTAEKEQPIAKDASAAELEQLRELGIANGFEDGLLHPEKTLTRAQFAKLLEKAFPHDTYASYDAEFSDVDKSHWAYESILMSAENYWLEGYPDGTFRPDEEITFEQAVTIMCRVLGIGYGGSYPQSYLSTAMEHSVSDGINALIGEKLNRAQAAKLIVNALNYEDSLNIAGNGYVGYSGGGSSKGASGGSGGSAAAMAPTAGLMRDSVADNSSGEESYIVGDDSLSYEMPVPAPKPDTNNEEYASNDENIFKDPLVSPLSTFSIDTDTASYSNLRRFIYNGQQIPDGSVRVEELINYFDYTKAVPDNDTPFGVNYTLGRCPWNENNLLAMLTVSGEEMTEPKPSNLVFLVDISGSMYSYNKLPLVKQSLSMLLDKLGENDTVSIVTYASGTGVALKPTPATEKEKIKDAINSLRAGGGTAGASGITLAYEQAEKNKTDGNNRIILCTDGDFNIGISSDLELKKLIADKRDSGIFLSVLGFGMGNYKDAKMEILADNGNGNYAYIDNLREAKKVLVDEMSKTIYTIAKDVKIQVEFNPATVGSYRLVGYENRILNTEDFENDKKDAGELGAGATVTVLYEIVPRDGDAEQKLKYQQATFTDNGELMNLKLRYKEPDGDTSIEKEYPLGAEISENPGVDFNFASAVAELGMLVNNSEYKGTSSFNSVIDLARASLGEDKFGIRCEFLQLADLLRYVSEN